MLYLRLFDVMQEPYHTDLIWQECAQEPWRTDPTRRRYPDRATDHINQGIYLP